MTTPTDRRITEAAIRLFVDKGTTQVTVSELAQAANVARGTLYRNIGSVSDLFDRVVADFSVELHERVSESFTGIDDPAARLATGLRMWVRYAYENPTIGRFAVRFGLSEESLRAVMAGPPMRDIAAGVESGRYRIDSLSNDSIGALVVGSTVSAMWMVLEGHQTWRDAGSSTAELVLRAMGIEPEEAHDIATSELPRLAT